MKLLDLLSRVASLKSNLANIKNLKDLGYEKPRAALALLALSFFATIYFLVALNAPPGWGPAFAGLSLCYLVAFLALASEWFWARWFATGLGWSGAMVGLFALVTIGWHPTLFFYGFVHALVIAALLGPKMAARYDLQPAWRERYGMDEFGVVKLRKAVTRAAAALPSLILWALGPKEGAAMAVAALLALTLCGLGLRGLVKARAWGALALTGAAGAAVIGAMIPSVFGGGLMIYGPRPLMDGVVLSWVGLLWLPLAVLPFVQPLARFLRVRG